MTPFQVVTDRDREPAKGESLTERIAALQALVRALSRQQVDEMRANVAGGIEAAREVIANPSQPEGVRQLAEKIVRDGQSLLLTLDAIVSRT